MLVVLYLSKEYLTYPGEPLQKPNRPQGHCCGTREGGFGSVPSSIDSLLRMAQLIPDFTSPESKVLIIITGKMKPSLIVGFKENIQFILTQVVADVTEQVARFA